MISIVIAAYNEGGIISNTVAKVLSYMRENFTEDWELIIVDDGSSDDTGATLDKLADGNGELRVSHHVHNCGQGKALRTGFGLCRGDKVVTLDADLSYGPEYITILLGALKEKKSDIALASPYTRGGTVRNVPMHRLLLSKWGNFYLARMSHYPISTSTSVVRAYRKETLDSLFLTADGMELQLEILMKSAMMRYKVCEVPANLAWDMDKLIEADISRVSKMRILKTVGLYLKMGWLFRPAYLFIVASAFMLAPGLYMAAFLFYRVATGVMSNLSHGIFTAVSLGLSQSFATHTYSFVISAGLLILGLQLFVFGMLVMQSQYYFEELYKMGQQVLFTQRRSMSGIDDK